MVDNLNRFIHDMNILDQLKGLKGPIKPRPSKDVPLEDDIYRVFKAMFLDEQITLDELKAYYLFLEAYFDDMWRTMRPNDYNDKTEIVKMMLELNRQLSENIKEAVQTHNILYTKKTNTKTASRQITFLPGDFDYMYTLLTGLIEAGVIVRAPRSYEYRRYPDLFNKKQTKFLKSEDQIDGGVMVREKKAIDKRMKEAKEMSFQPAPTFADHKNVPFMAKDKTTMSFIWTQEMEPERLLLILRLFFIPKSH